MRILVAIANHGTKNRAFLDRLREHWKGRLIVKGVLDHDDARRIRDAGADAVYVSNHGGRQLDSAPAAIQVLPAIRAAVGPDYPLLFDSGVRNGESVIKALALGADFVFIGRPFLYAMGADAETNELKNLIFFRNLEDGSEEMTLAKRGTISFNIDKNQIEVGLFESETFTFPAGPSEEYRFVKARERHVTLPPDPSLRARLDFMSRDVPKNYSELSLGELRKKYRRAANLAQPSSLSFTAPHCLAATRRSRSSTTGRS